MNSPEEEKSEKTVKIEYKDIGPKEGEGGKKEIMGKALRGDED